MPRMTPEARVNARVIDIITRGKNGQSLEADNVELKGGWFAVEEDYYKIARQIAGCANASMGNDFTLLIGIQEKPEFEVLGVPDTTEPSNWWTNVRNCFAGAAPSVKTTIVSYEDKSVVALVFNTTLAPFLVKNQHRKAPNQKGDIAAEVPWREMGGARTATRDELLSLLVFSEMVPACELRDCKLSQGHDAGHYMLLSMVLYIEPKTERRLTIPFHRCTAYVRMPDGVIKPFRVTRIFPGVNEWAAVAHRAPSATIQPSATEILINGPGMIEVHARLQESFSAVHTSPLEVVMGLNVSGSAIPVSIGCTVRPTPTPNNLPYWCMDR